MKTLLATRTLILIFLACFGGWSANQSYARDDHPSAEQKNDDALHRLLTARYETAIKTLEFQRQKWQSGKATTESVIGAAARMRDAMLELSANDQGRLDVLTKHVALTRELEETARKMVEKGALPEGESTAARYWRLSAEIDLLRNQTLHQAGKAGPDQRKLSERHEFQLLALEAEIKKFKLGESTVFNLMQFARDLRDVELQMSNTEAQRIAALSRHAALIRAFERQTADPLERASTAAERKRAESELNRAKQPLDER